MMLRSSINNASRLLLNTRPLVRSANTRTIIQHNHKPAKPPSLASAAAAVFGCRSMAVAANANASDAPMITPGTPISTPTLIDIDKRWLDLTAQQQLDIFKALHEREKEPWYTMTTEERKALYYINFGPHGPRAERVKDGWQIVGGLVTCMAISFSLFWVLRQYLVPPPPRTMTKEWQEATNERLKTLGIEPISGPGSPDYKGKGVIYGDFVNKANRQVPHEEDEE